MTIDLTMTAGPAAGRSRYRAIEVRGPRGERVG